MPHADEVPRGVRVRDRKQDAEGQKRGAGDGELELNGDRISVWEDKKICTWVVVMAAQQREYASRH